MAPRVTATLQQRVARIGLVAGPVFALALYFALPRRTSPQAERTSSSRKRGARRWR